VPAVWLPTHGDKGRRHSAAHPHDSLSAKEGLFTMRHILTLALALTIAISGALPAVADDFPQCVGVGGYEICI
jgi:hypothetical protein